METDADMAPVLSSGPMKAIGSPSPPTVAWTVLALGGLILAVLALASDPAVPTAPDAGGHLVVELPRPLVMLAVGAAALAVFVFFAFMLALARLRGKDEEARRSLWGMLLFPVLIGLALLAHDGRLEGLFNRLQTPAPGSPLGDWSVWAFNGPAVSVPVVTGLLSAFMLAAGLGSLALVCWMLLGERIREWWAVRRALVATAPLADAVDESLDDLRDEPDARRAIVRCYRRFEQALARSAVARAPWQTPMELMREALGRLPLPAPPVSRLTRLFERARFSEEPMAAEDRDAAWDDLRAIRASLEAERA